MAITRRESAGLPFYYGLSSDTKPTGSGLDTGAEFFETDSGILYVYTGTEWVVYVTPGGGGGGGGGDASAANQVIANASLSTLDDWDEADRAKVNVIVGQAGVAAGAGAVGATTIRTTSASDDPAVTNLASIVTSLGNLLTELNQKLEPGGSVELGATTLAALETIQVGSISTGLTATDVGTVVANVVGLAATANLRFYGFAAMENAGSPAAAEFILRHGDDTLDPVLYPVTLSADQSTSEIFSEPGILSPNGIYVDWIAGSFSLVLYTKVVP